MAKATDRLRRGVRHQGKQIEDYAKKNEEASYSHEHEKGDGIIPLQRKCLDHYAEKYECSRDPQARRDGTHRNLSIYGRFQYFTSSSFVVLCT